MFKDFGHLFERRTFAKEIDLPVGKVVITLRTPLAIYNKKIYYFPFVVTLNNNNQKILELRVYKNE